MGRKVFISFLGATNYGECKYEKSGFVSTSVRYIQEATLKYLTQQEEWTDEDVIYILLTKGAEEKNWRDYGHSNGQEGLKSRLNALSLSCRIETISNLPNGNNEKEIWTIFERIFEQIKDGDSLFFDITHGFRYLPMLTLVLGNYTKFLKKAIVKSITYGNFESRDENNQAPIIDLLPLTTLQDWTFAAANYLKNGNVTNLVELCNSELKPILIETKGKNENVKDLQRFISSLQKVIDERVSCRGINITTSENFKTLKRTSDKLSNTFIEPFNPIFNRIQESLQEFDENENVQNGFAAVKWCLDFGLYQQATTILLENIVTFICMKNGLNWKIESERLLVNTAFNVKLNHIDETLWKISNKEVTLCERQNLISKVKVIINSCEVEKLLKLFVSLADLRNDFNHAGMRNNPMSADKLKFSIHEKYNQIKDIISSC